MFTFQFTSGIHKSMWNSIFNFKPRYKITDCCTYLYFYAFSPSKRIHVDSSISLRLTQTYRFQFELGITYRFSISFHFPIYCEKNNKSCLYVKSNFEFHTAYGNLNFILFWLKCALHPRHTNRLKDLLWIYHIAFEFKSHDSIKFSALNFHCLN